MRSRHVLPAPGRLGPKAKDREALVGVRSEDGGDRRDGGGVGREGGTVGAEVVEGVRFLGIATVCMG